MSKNRAMIDIWKRAINELAASMNISPKQAADLIMQEVRNEANKIGEQEMIGLSTGIFFTMTYDPMKDPFHPMHGWRPE